MENCENPYPIYYKFLDKPHAQQHTSTTTQTHKHYTTLTHLPLHPTPHPNTYMQIMKVTLMNKLG